MSESFGEWLHDNMPEVWNEIRANNASEGWKAPGFFNSPRMISPRFFISDRLLRTNRTWMITIAVFVLCTG